MSEISEQKALEEYPFVPIECGGGIADSNLEYRGLYQEGYDQAIQDFLEKAERYLKYTLYDRVEIEVFGTLIPSIVNKKAFIEDFKNYMQNESEN
jgi:hypothetical protein